MFAILLTTVLVACTQTVYCGDHGYNVTNGSISNGIHTFDNHSDNGHESGHLGVHIAEIRFKEIREPIVFTLVVLLAALSKIGFHYADKLSSYVPESCLLIIVGTIFGAIIHFSGVADDLPEFFTPDAFFHYLLPPIILESAYCLYDRTFSENLGSVIIFAVLGTIAACSLLGLSLIGLMAGGAMEHFDASPVQLLVFASLIVAVDPVAVLAVFNEIGVNRVLYFLVFGESLLNDGVTVVLYNVLQSYNRILRGENGLDGRAITAVDITLGFIKFFVVCFGGLSIGVIVGALTAVITKYTNTVKVIEPVVIFGMTYIAFLLAEMFHFSGIISIIGCGMMQVAYAFHNITPKSKTTVKFFTKVMSTTSEIIIFLFLGLLLVRPDHQWKTGFTLWTIFLCTLFRFIIVFVISSLINRYDHYRVRKIHYDEMFIMSYGGLRGAVCFSLVALLDEKEFGADTKDIFITTTLAVIIFTVFIQGATIKPIVEKMRVSKAADIKHATMYEELNSHINDHLMACMEEIAGNEGKNVLRAKLYRLDDKYVKKILLKDHRLTEEEFDLVNCYEKLMIKEHYRNLHLCGAKTLPSAANDMRNVDSSALLDKLARESKHIADDEPINKDEEQEEATPPKKVDFSIGDTNSFRRFLDVHALRPRSRMVMSDENVYGFAKNDVSEISARNKLQRKATLMENVNNKRKYNRKLQRMKSISCMRERALSWSEDDAAARRRVQGRSDLNHRGRALTMDVSPPHNSSSPLKQFQTIPEIVTEINETEGEAEESKPLIPSVDNQGGSNKGDKSVEQKQCSVDRHSHLQRQGAFSSEEIPLSSLKKANSMD